MSISDSELTCDEVMALLVMITRRVETMRMTIKRKIPRIWATFDSARFAAPMILMRSVSMSRICRICL